MRLGEDAMGLSRRRLLLGCAGLAAGCALTPEAAEPVSLPDYEEGARRRLPPSAYDYIAGGAADEITLRWNREAYNRLRLRPRVLIDVSRIDTRIKILGLELPHPILLAPTAYHKVVHPDGEVATARGAASSGAVFVVSSNSTSSIEDITSAATSPLWFQLYVRSDPGLNREMIQRVQAAGCRALCVTVDTPVLGPRNREQRSGFTLPAELSLPMNPETQKARQVALSSSAVGNSRRVSLTWKEIEEFLSLSAIPVLLKGILDPDDADRAARMGLGGIIVSNHGGRNLDTAPATIDALPAIVDRVAGRIPVLVDGGIRRGTDVVKALAHGAAAVLIGRPYLYGLSLSGAEGVARVVQILRSELEMAMALIGRAKVSALDRTAIG
jgi:4-hydroxymandelate oxidase